MSSRAYSRFSLFVLVLNVAIVAWGAYVRATGAGAGCGSHWPLCNGQVVPVAPQVKTLVELSHRLSSGLGLVLTVLMCIWAFRVYARGHAVRKAAVACVVLYFAEALIGAGLVLFKLVERDESVLRVVSISLHLVNTFLLLGAFTLNARFARTGRGLGNRSLDSTAILLGTGLLLMLLLGVSGAVNALGDTLFPVATLAQGLDQDRSATSSLLLKLRVLHPVLAVLTAAYVGYVSLLVSRVSGKAARRAALALVGAFAVQLGCGILNLVLLAPVWMQLLHLVLADAAWILLVLFCALMTEPAGEIREPVSGLAVT